MIGTVISLSGCPNITNFRVDQENAALCSLTRPTIGACQRNLKNALNICLMNQCLCFSDVITLPRIYRLVTAGAGYFARWSTFKAIERNRAEYMSKGRMLRTENNGYAITFSNPRS